MFTLFFGIAAWVWLIEIFLFIVTCTILLMAESENSYDHAKDWWAFVFSIAMFAVWQFGTPFDPKAWLIENALRFLGYFVLYLVIGFSWSVFKWFRLVKREHKKYLNDKREWVAKVAKDWPPEPSKHKARIIRWILVWPVSFFWAITSDLFIWIGEKIYALAGQIYSKISNAIFADLIKEREQIIENNLAKQGFNISDEEAKNFTTNTGNSAKKR